jgi:hypothetical protein
MKHIKENDMNVEQTRQLVYVTGQVVSDTGLEMSGMRFDSKVVGFGAGYSEGDAPVAYNVDQNVFYISTDTLTAKQRRALYGIAYELNINIIEDGEKLPVANVG